MIKCVRYSLPDYESSDVQLYVDKTDEDFFNNNNLEVIQKPLRTGELVFYSTTGVKYDDGEDVGAIYFPLLHESITDSIKGLRKLVEKVREESV